MLLPISVITFILLAAAAAIFFIWRLTQQQGEEKQQSQSGHGFAALENPPEELLSRIRSLQLGRQTPARVSDVYRKVVLNGELYFFDLIRPGEDGDSREEGCLMAVSPALHLPRMVIFPLPNLGGAWGEKMNDLVGAITGWAGGYLGLEPVSLPLAGIFDERFTVLAEDAAEAQAFLTPERVRAFSAMPTSVVFQSAGDALQVQAIHVRGKSKDDLMDSQIAIATRLMTTLE